MNQLPDTTALDKTTLPPGVVSRLATLELETVGDLRAHIRDHGLQRIRNVKGIGDGAIDKIRGVIAPHVFQPEEWNDANPPGEHVHIMPSETADTTTGTDSFDRSLNIHQRMHLARELAPYVKKTGQMPDKAGGYSYATHTEVARLCNEALRKARVSIVVSVTGSDTKFTAKNQVWTTVTMDVSFVNIDNPEDQITVKAEGQGLDYHEKAINKAQSNALKYCLMKNFLMEAGDDDEEDRVGPPIAPSPNESSPIPNSTKQITQRNVPKLQEQLEDSVRLLAINEIKDWSNCPADELKMFVRAAVSAMGILPPPGESLPEEDWALVYQWAKEQREQEIPFAVAVRL